MKIAVLSWGSLVRESAQRGLEALDWQSGGPRLPIEFSRVSQSGERQGCLTLVLDEFCGTFCPTRYAVSTNTNLNAAIKNLRLIEGGKQKCNVAYINLLKDTSRDFAEEHHPLSCWLIENWARHNEFEGVVWTSLLSNFEVTTGEPFSIDNAKKYLDNLEPIKRAAALEYIRGAPDDIVTAFRSTIQRA